MTLSDRTFNDLLHDLGDKTPAPGGGAAAPLVAAIAAAMGRMVQAYSIDKNTLKDHRADNELAMQQLGQLQSHAMHCADEDATAYAALNALMKLDANDPRRQSEWAGAVDAAMAPPRRAIELCSSMLELLVQLSATTNQWLGSDLAVAAVLAAAAARCAAWNVRANLSHIEDGPGKDELRADVESQINRLDLQARELELQIGMK